MSTDGGSSWTEHGDIRVSSNDRYRGWAENNIVELTDGRIAMIIRADRLGGILDYAESADGGSTWPEFARKSSIPNPGSKATLYPLGGHAVALLHNPNPKHRSPLALWVSFEFQTAIGNASSLARHAQHLGQRWLHGLRCVESVWMGAAAN